MQDVDPKELEKLKQSNLSKLEGLARQGIQLSVGDLAFLKMEALIDLLVTETSDRQRLDMAVELKKKEIVDHILAEIRKAQIMDGVPQTANKLNLRT